MNQIAAIIEIPKQEQFENNLKFILYDQASDSS